jgi:hypothetical protein
VGLNSVNILVPGVLLNIDSPCDMIRTSTIDTNLFTNTVQDSDIPLDKTVNGANGSLCL